MYVSHVTEVSGLDGVEDVCKVKEELQGRMVTEFQIWKGDEYKNVIDEVSMNMWTSDEN